jgi:hypothetical protein
MQMNSMLKEKPLICATYGLDSCGLVSFSGVNHIEMKIPGLIISKWSSYGNCNSATWSFVISMRVNKIELDSLSFSS